MVVANRETSAETVSSDAPHVGLPRQGSIRRVKAGWSQNGKNMRPKLFKFQLPHRGWRRGDQSGGGGEKKKKKEGTGGVLDEKRENLYQSDHSSVLLQSPDKAGTAGGETMCIKTS